MNGGKSLINDKRVIMGNTNKPDDIEHWLLNDATLEEIEKIANG